MKCNPLQWLWGLIPIALLAWFATQLEHDRIEKDLAQRVQEQFVGSGLKWPTTAFNGRDGLITGQALDEADPTRAADIARSVWGVRVVDSKASLLDKIENYNWGVVRAGNNVRLTGYVPSEAVRATVLAQAKATFGGAQVLDEMRLARGAPQLDTWQSGIAFGMKQVAGLKAGEAKLDMLALSVAGEAATVPAYRSVKTALARELPRGLKLSNDRVTAPVVKPFAWTAQTQSNQVVLGGYVPGERAREDILAAAKSIFPRTATVSDKMEPAEGSTQGHVQAAIEALKALAQLEEGSAEIKDAALSVGGMAASEQVAIGVKAGVRNATPKPFTVSDAIKFRDTGPRPISPYTTVATVDGDAVILTGYAPSDAAKAAAGQLAAQRFPGRRIDNRLDIGAGAPDGWQRCFEAGLGGVARVGSGRVAMTDRRMDVTGSTDDETLVGAVTNDVRAQGGAVCDANVRIDVRAEAVPDLSWRAVAAGNDVVLEGDVPNATTKDALMQTARRVFAGRGVTDRMRIVETRTRLWPTVAEQGLVSLSLLKAGQATLQRGQLTVSGEASSEGTAGDARSRLRDVAKGYNARDQISVAVAVVPTPPQPAPPPPAPAPAPVVVAPRPAPVPAPPVIDLAAKRCEDSLRSAAREGTIRFERASATLARDSTSTLNKLAQAAKACPKVRIEIEGHTDNEGTPERNDRLSNRRAQAVVDFLARSGVEPQKLNAVGYGETRPLVPNDSAPNRALNRRIEFTVKAE